MIGSGLVYLAGHPDLFSIWYHNLIEGNWYLEHTPPVAGHGILSIVAISVLFFPKLALGLSGFETGVAVMPLIKGGPDDTPENPRGRIRNARLLLTTAALIMSVYLLGSAVVTATLIPPQELIKPEAAAEIAPAGMEETGGKAADRRWPSWRTCEGPYNINPLFGERFGTLYDLATVVILSFAGLSAMAGLLNLVPQYLPRYGMAPEWTRAVRPLVVLFTLINLLVTWIFRRRRRSPGRSLRHRCVGADQQCLHGHDYRLVPAARGLLDSRGFPGRS